MARCGQSVWYIYSVCLRIMIHIAEAVIGVLDLNGYARQIAGPTSALDCSYGFRVIGPIDNFLLSDWRGSARSYIKQGTHASIRYNIFINNFLTIIFGKVRFEKQSVTKLFFLQKSVSKIES
ncbi:uncharacterized protein Smp_203990 [Schistosoma mansoni]|uniref:Transposase n=1 Tax=Schistosoma mansoni TaxID=6183 RepID=A0A3Q0KV09_SCHMA|nr:uncharacterized protein Smp_203990 [Schistosoma mansoni]|eukprot:XP_018655501.1 uncharacterized protein Smp_203990 [Schistosoma mansoni]